MSKLLGKLVENIHSTSDLVVFILATFVVSVLTLCVLGVFLYSFIHPDHDLNDPLKTVTDIITVIVGALVGFIGGKAAGRQEGQQEERNRSE